MFAWLRGIPRWEWLWVEDEEDGRTLVVGDEEEDKCIGADGGKV